jgi:polyphosphate kinase 2 (PPK2 family)
VAQSYLEPDAVFIGRDWVKRIGQRIIVVFEGRDAAGKGGAIRALTVRY